MGAVEQQPSERAGGMRSLLAFPSAYRAYQRLIGDGTMRRAVVEQLSPEPGNRFLDIGCGAADILEYLPDVTYLGFDQSERYIERARRRWGDRGSFFTADVTDVDPAELGTFDRVLAHGVLHHVSDDIASGLIALAARALEPSGRFVTIDGCWDDRQSRAARFFLEHDRGKAIRTPDEYRMLGEQAFARVDVHVRHDLLRIPYTLAILTCRDPRPRDKRNAPEVAHVTDAE